MALGGGTYLVQNKVLGGAYFKFLSAMKATATIGDRGVGAIALDMNWCEDGKIFTVTANEFLRDSLEIFGYDYSAPEMQSIRELFLHARDVHFYRLNGAEGAKASNAFGTAKYKGTRGNDIKVVIATNVDNESNFDVSVYVGNTVVSTQTVASASELDDNEFIVWNDEAELSVTAGTPLTGGTNGTSATSDHQSFLNQLESYPDTNAVGYVGNEETVKALYCSYAKRLRDEVGIYLQAVVYNKPADSISVVNVKNNANLVAWVTGVIAGTQVNKSATNMTYDGELTVNTNYTQRQLENCIKAGEFVLHKVGDEVRVLEDLNSFVSITDEVGDVFCDNQTIRIIDELATSIATVFCKKYLGKVPNDASGRISLWSDICKICQQLNDIRALEDFDPAEISVNQGDTKKSVVVNAGVTVVNSMVRLYMKTIIA